MGHHRNDDRVGSDFDAAGEQVDIGGALVCERQFGPSVGHRTGVAGETGEEGVPGHKMTVRVRCCGQDTGALPASGHRLKVV